MMNRRQAEIRGKTAGRPYLSIFLFVVFAVSLSCSSKPTDMRSLAPSDSLVYLETNDIAAALQPIVDSAAFEEAAASKPDLSALKGIQLAIAVTGFELSEERLTDEHSIGRVKPRFVAIAETHAWNWQAVAFAENRIGAFVTDVYNSDVSQERSDKFGGKYFVWSASDGRKAYALVSGSMVYFGNDETAIEKCLASARGESPNIAGNSKVPAPDGGNIAVGYVSPDGMKQIASFAGMAMASQTDDEPEIRSAIAGLLPQVLRGAVTEVVWTSRKADGRLEDKYSITTPDAVAHVLSETLVPAGKQGATLFELVPQDIPGVTSYDLRDPHVAWRSILLTSQSLLDPMAGRLLVEFAGAFTEPYAVRDPELFLSGVGPNVLTGRLDAEGEKPVVVAAVVIEENVRRSLADLKPDKASSDLYGIHVLRSEDGDLAAAFLDNMLIAGDAEAVMSCLKARSENRTIGKSPALVKLFATGAAVTTLAADRETAPAIAAVLSEKRANTSPSAYTVETRFSRNGVDRRTVSDFGLIGWIIAQLTDN